MVQSGLQASQNAMDVVGQALQAKYASHPGLTASGQQKASTQAEKAFSAMNQFMADNDVTLKDLARDAGLQDRALHFVANETEPYRGQINWEKETNLDYLERVGAPPELFQAADVLGDARREALADRVRSGVVPDKPISQMSTAEIDYLAQDKLKAHGLLFTPDDDKVLHLEFFEKTRGTDNANPVHPEASAIAEEDRIIEAGGSEAVIAAEQEQQEKKKEPNNSKNQGMDW